MKQGPQGRPAGWPSYATLFLKVLDGIPGNSAPGTTIFPFEATPVTNKRTTKRREKGQLRHPSCHTAQLAGLHCRFPAVSPGPVPLPVLWAPSSHPEGHHFARLTSGKLRCVPFRPRYERICIQKHTDRQWAPSETDLERPQWRARCALPPPLPSGWETANKIAGEGADQ